MEWKKEQLRSIGRLSKEKLIFVFCAGLLLFILSLPDKGDSVMTGSSETAASFMTSGSSAAGTSYESDLEARIIEILRDVDGVGDVEVMVVLKASEEEILRSSFAEKLIYPELSGVIISADGGGSTLVKAEISGAMEALFGLPPHKIKILKRVKKGV